MAVLSDIKDSSSWNTEISTAPEAEEGSWYQLLSATRGMLHQFTGQQFSNLNHHYSPLNSCSDLLESTFPQSPAKVAENNDCKTEPIDYYSEEKRDVRNDPGKQCQQQEPQPPFDVNQQELQKNANESKNKLVPKVESHEQPVQSSKECDNDTSQLINDEQNNNAQKLQQIKNDVDGDSFDYQKYASEGEDTKLLEFIDLDMETIMNVPLSESDGYKHRLESTANEIHKICDENDSNFRLPGFHQAFGSTEIGRFVHQKDYIEQTVVTQPIIPPQPPSSLHQQQLQQQPKPPMMLQNPPPLNGLPNSIGSPKPKRYNKRIKTPTDPSAGAKNQSWQSYEPEGDTSTSVVPPNGSYYKRSKESMRRTKTSQNLENNPAAMGYYQGEEYHYNCSSSPYYGSCSDYPNCEYYQYQQHSQYQNYAHYANNMHSNYSYTGYADEHSQRLGYGGASMMPYSHNQNWRSERFFPYGEQVPYRYRQNNTTSYMYQHQYVSQNQHLPPQQSYNTYGYTSYPSSISNYNYFS